MTNSRCRSIATPPNFRFGNLCFPHTGTVAYDHLSLIHTHLQFNVSARRPALHSPYSKAMNMVKRVEMRRLELLTPSLQRRCSPN